MENIIVSGSTGGVGRRCVHFLLLDPRVGSVKALARSATPKPLEFFGAGYTDEQAAKLQQVQVDSANLEPSRTSLQGVTGGISCLGLYTNDVKDLEEFMVEHSLNLGVAKFAAGLGATKWGYLSGMGVTQPSEGQTKSSFMQPMFSFVKGLVERDLSQVDGFVRATSVRPGGIVGRPLPNKMTGALGFFEPIINSSLLSGVLVKTPYFVHTDDIAKSLVEAVLSGEPGSNIVLENQDIKRVAREYDERNAVEPTE